VQSVKDFLMILGPIIGVSGFIFGLYQYYIGQKWKKSEFAAKQLEQLANDARLATCCQLLDWSTRTLPVPEPYRALTKETVFLHEWHTLANAMLPEVQKGSFEWQEILYRDLFDHFFNYLERLNHCIGIKLITVKDVASLKYWLQQIAAPRFGDKPVFIDFIRAYGYLGVLELMNKFGVEYK